MKKIIYAFIISICLSLPALAIEPDQATKADASTGHTASGDETSGGASFSQVQYIPDISVVVDLSYVQRNMKNETHDGLEVPELIHSAAEEAEAGHSHGAMNGDNGFNLNYAELGFYSAVDPYFDLFAVCHLSTEGAELEEAYFTTLMLPLGFKVKGGKFLSGFGRINEQHAHYLDFAERPLIYQGIFGGEGLNETGLRLSWVAPTDFYLLLAAECLMGENESSFGKDGFTSPNSNVSIDGTPYPELYTGNIRTSFDIDNLCILLGTSGAFGKNRINHGIDETGEEGHAMTGNTMVLGGDITLRYQFDSVHYLALQGEYLYRHMDGDLYEKDSSDAVTTYDIDEKQSGLYAQLVGGISKDWRIGIRYDLIHLNRVKKNGARQDIPENDPRYSVMAEYKPTEFSRFRVQYNMDRSLYNENDKRVTNHEVIVQANLLIGAHGAHSF